MHKRKHRVPTWFLINLFQGSALLSLLLIGVFLQSDLRVF